MASRPDFFHASLETRSFSFDAYGATEKLAKHAMRRAWEKHRKQTDAEYTFADLEESVHIRPVTLNTAYRDDELLIP